MADLNSCSSSQPPNSSSFTLESDDISTLLYSLLHSSSSSVPSNCPLFAPGAAASTTPARIQQDPRREFPGSVAFSDGAVGYLGFPFAGDSGGAFPAVGSSSFGGEWGNNDEHPAAATGVGKSASSSTSSSKRSRPPDVHNMSEKRRRQKINEKMKALQKLIPNSNKTDKASMLDEAIEYLKQLQLQVQMLAMRNGGGDPFYLSGGMMHHHHPTQSTQEGGGGGDGVPPNCTSHGFSSVEEMIPLTTGEYAPLNNQGGGGGGGLTRQKVAAVLPGSSSCSGMELSAAPPHCRPLVAFNMASKGGHCNDSKLPQLELDMSRFGDDSSSGVSS